MREILRKKYETPSVALQNMAGIPVEWIVTCNRKFIEMKRTQPTILRGKINSAIIRTGQEQNENVECMSF